MSTLLPFTLAANDGEPRSFPTVRHALLAFVKEDCPTCGLSMPLIQAAQEAFGSRLDVLVIGQDAAGNAKLVERHGLTAPMLDDSALKVSFAYDLDTVPTVILADERATELARFVGFGRDDWRALFERLAAITGLPNPAMDWAQFPESRPGCGSKSVEPGIAERLIAEAEGSPLRARRIEIGPSDDEAEFLFDQGLTDGLPVVAPTPERVLRMLSGTKRGSQEVVATLPPNLAPITVEKVAINAVMAGCRPEYLPVVIAALEAVCTEEFNGHGVMATTMGASPVLVVNGPIRQRIGMNMKMSVLGQGNRANATIGRAVRLCLRNVGGSKPGGTERSTLGTPMKYTLSFAEWEERSPWEPYHVSRGFRPDESVVTVFPLVSGPSTIIDQTSRTARGLGGTFGLALAAVLHPRMPMGDTLLVVSPEHADTFSRNGFTKDDVRNRIIEASTRPLRELIETDECGGIPASMYGPGGPTAEQLAAPVTKVREPEKLHIVVAGGEAGKFSALFGGWGTLPTSRVIEE